MDLVVAGTDDSLVEQLSFKLPSTASYATERRLVSSHPSGASQFAPDGVRVARFVLSGENWLDPSTLRLAFKLKNTHATDTLQLASGPWCLYYGSFGEVNGFRVFFAGSNICQSRKSRLALEYTFSQTRGN